MDNKQTIRQGLTALKPGKTMVMCDPKQPEKIIVQASRVGEVYYITGPLFYDYAPEVDLETLFQVGLDNKDDQANVASMLNKYLGDHGVPAAAQLHVCQGLENAFDTLGALFATYTLSTAR